MEILRRKNKSSSSSICDDDNYDLASIKSAAWAWFQHGSAAEATYVRESQVSRVHQQEPPPRRPSRYKVEAMLTGWLRTVPGSSDSYDDDDELATKSSLLDSYETERISKQLGQFLAQPDGMRSETTVGLIPKSTDHEEAAWRMRWRKKTTSTLLKGLLVAKRGGGVTVTCGGSSRDVDERAQRTLLPRRNGPPPQIRNKNALDN